MKANIIEWLLLVFKPRLLKNYTKQTRRSFHDRYKECISSYKYSTTNSAYVQHLLGNGHSMGHNEEIMGTLHFAEKGRFMNNFENSYIYHESVKDVQINGKTTARTNRILCIIVYYDHSTQRPLH
jgi:thermostable 8-oxoguanine DNA glycosylase